MKAAIIFFFSITLSSLSVAQAINDFLISGQMDFIKTDINKVFGKVQAGLEVNYFLKDGFSVGAGGEFRSLTRDSFAFGIRWYPKEAFFVRVRGLIGDDDFNIGGGWVIPINRNFNLEAIADFYTAHPDLALRGGVTYSINYFTRK